MEDLDAITQHELRNTDDEAVIIMSCDRKQPCIHFGNGEVKLEI